MKFISYDLGTGGVKASLYDEDLSTLEKIFIEYTTEYPQNEYHEQKPMDWWQSVIDSTRLLIAKTGIDSKEIDCIALSGHSCCAVPIDENGNLLESSVPIWSDTRAVTETEEFFRIIDRDDWYMKTGNGFPPACYAVFKLMWIKKNHPEIFKKTDVFLGSKDFINFLLTGKKYTDYSYASSFGVYNLRKKSLDEELLKAAGIEPDKFPPIIGSHCIVGSVTKDAARETGLAEGTSVACGGVDNMCMALGAVGTEKGRVYVSLGSSSWIPVNTKEPILDPATRPYVFAHAEPDMYTSAYSIFAGGSSFKWAKNNLCRDFCEAEDAYERMSFLASKSPLGANGIIFNPSLAGGTSQDKSVNIRGSFIGLHLGTTREDMIRSTMEGIAMNLKMSLDLLSQKVEISREILFCGGGAKSHFWMQMFADVFGKEIIKTNVDQDAASLGAAAICARATGLIENYEKIPQLHKVENRSIPDEENYIKYRKLMEVFRYICNLSSDLGDFMQGKLVD